MASQQTGSYGSWNSPITADAVVAESVSLSEPRIDGHDIYWIEGRPLEKGRSVLVRRGADGTIGDVTPAPFNVRTQVYSYGGGAYAVGDGVVYFVNFADGQIHLQVPVQAPAGAPTKITSGATGLFADLCIDARRSRLIAVREERPNGDVVNAIHSLVAVDIATGRETLLDGGADFYAYPTLSPDGAKLAWLTWQHPHMPWTATALNVADVDPSGALTGQHVVAGGSESQESIFQPQWSPDGTLYFMSDRTDFWNLYRLGASGIEPVLARDAEFGVPQWIMGLSTYTFLSRDALIYSFVRDGSWRMGRLDLTTLTARDDAAAFASLSGLRASARTVVMRCATPASPAAIATVDADTG